MSTSHLAAFLLFLTSCAALPNPDGRHWADADPSVPELSLHEPVFQPAVAAIQEAVPEPAPARAPQASRIWIYLGGRQLDEDDYSPLEDQGTLGLEYSFEGRNSLIGFEAGFMGSADEANASGTSVVASTAEFYGGVRKTFRRHARLQPYLGGGLSLIASRIDGLLADDSDTAFGGYVHGGATVRLGKSFHLGLDLRTLFGTSMTLLGNSTDADYSQVAIVLGWLL